MMLALSFVLSLSLAVVPPLSTRGTEIVDAAGETVKLGCVNWYGAEQLDYVVGGLAWQSVDQVAATIARLGFNCIRLPFSTELVVRNPVLSNATVLAREPSLLHGTALEALDKVVQKVTSVGVMVILDNHNSDAEWCCGGSDGNGLWWTEKYPEPVWMDAWESLIKRYTTNPMVIGCDLRNEPRSTVINGTSYKPTWGDNSPLTDWRAAAVRLGRRIQGVNPHLLLFVEGTNYALDLHGVSAHPITSPADLPVPSKLVYSAHAYSFDTKNHTYASLSSYYSYNWGFIVETGLAPVWVGEFGTCHHDSCTGADWWVNTLKYFKTTGNSFGYWALDGTQSTAKGKTYGHEESYGILNTTWDGVASQTLVDNVISLLN